ncbi:MAG: HAD family phosphatase [Clostridia bacterium]|nr:HAD family phosphatase [Clostridia bacterium]
MAYVIFDLDGTLAPLGKPCPEECARILRELEIRGVRIVISSGKPTYYLCGFARQLGLSDPVLIGENGAVLQMGIALPPRVFRIASIPSHTVAALKELRRLLEENFPDRFWYQPNETTLTPFLYHVEDFPALRAFVTDYLKPEMELCLYEHSDCMDIGYAHLSKGDGIRLLSEVSGEDPRNMIAVGDWTNDYPMFEAVGHSVGISLPDPARATVNVSSLFEALSHVRRRLFPEN